jgi:hypothetical protein
MQLICRHRTSCLLSCMRYISGTHSSCSTQRSCSGVVSSWLCYCRPAAGMAMQCGTHNSKRLAPERIYSIIYTIYA